MDTRPRTQNLVEILANHLGYKELNLLTTLYHFSIRNFPKDGVLVYHEDYFNITFTF